MGASKQPRGVTQREYRGGIGVEEKRAGLSRGTGRRM
jgi:hypothetical protein